MGDTAGTNHFMGRLWGRNGGQHSRSFLYNRQQTQLKAKAFCERWMMYVSKYKLFPLPIS